MAVMKEEGLEKLSERDEIEALLPWYVAGRLDANARARVERYIEAHPEVKAQVALAREEADATIAANEAIVAPGRRALDRLRMSVAAAPRRQSASGLLSQLSDRFADWLAGFAPPRLALAGAVAALLIALQAAAIGILVMERASTPTYQTAGGGQAEGEGFALLVAFSPGATIGDIGDLLKRLDATVTDGPKAGLYRLRFHGATEGDADRDAAIEALKRSGIAASVLPAE
jgi:anti-sigma-K factor RskA